MSWPWSTPITSQLGKKNDSCPATLSFQRRIHLRVLCLHRVWHHPPQQTGRNAPLWRLLLHDLSAGSSGRWLGDVVLASLKSFFKHPERSEGALRASIPCQGERLEKFLFLTSSRAQSGIPISFHAI